MSVLPVWFTAAAAACAFVVLAGGLMLAGSLLRVEWRARRRARRRRGYLGGARSAVCYHPHAYRRRSPLGEECLLCGTITGRGGLEFPAAIRR